MSDERKYFDDVVHGRMRELVADDRICPKCGKTIKGAARLVSVAVYLHNETAGECTPAPSVNPEQGKQTKVR